MRVIATEVGRYKETTRSCVKRGVVYEADRGDSKKGHRFLCPGSGTGFRDKVASRKSTCLGDNDLGQRIHHPVKEASVAARCERDKIVDLSKRSKREVILIESRL
jgi:hypothetical protein